MRRHLIAGVILGGSLALMVACPSGALAYRRTTVDDIPDGTPLFWSRRTIPFRDLFTAIPGVPTEDARAALNRSVLTWSHAGECTNMVLVHRGATWSERTNITGGAPDMENHIVFRATAWPADVGAQTLALTTTVYRRSTGEILDADIDVNAVNHAWSAGPDPTGFDDIENTLTHELGHAIGFAHTEVLDATMFADADLGETLKRDLAPDDLDAICSVYPLPPPSTHIQGVLCTTTHSRAGWPALSVALATLALAMRRKR